MIVRRMLRLAPTAALAAAAGAVWASARPRPGPKRAVTPEPPPLPPARLVHVPGRGEFFLRDAPGPDADAPTALLLHGWMFPADPHWFRCYEALGQVARVIAVDHRGHGRGLRASQPFRLVDVADDAAALVRHLGVGPTVVVGYSMGGPIAQLFWQRHPDLVRGLVLCATSDTFNVTARDRWMWRGMGLLQVALRLLPRHWWERLVSAQAEGRLPFRFTRMIRPHASEEIRALLPWMIGEFDRGSAEDIAEAGRELSRYDARGWLAGVDVPTAIILTTEDDLVPIANQRAMAARIPHASVYELALAHDAVLAGAEAFVPALAKAVSDVL